MTNKIDLDLEALLSDLEGECQCNDSFNEDLISSIVQESELLEQTLKNTLYEAALEKQELLNHIDALEESSLEDFEDILELRELAGLTP